MDQHRVARGGLAEARTKKGAGAMEELAHRYGIWILLALIIATYCLGGTYKHRNR
jgi:hypothetical protein